MNLFKKLRPWQWIVIVVVGVPVLAFVFLGLLPAPSDPILAPDQIIVGAQNNAQSTTGLPVDFPPMVIPAQNPITPDKAELGRLLFFDPLLSANHQMACATCHQPDLGLSDGRATGRGSDGQPLPRHVPGLYEVAYKTSLFWDGRAQGLEAQITQHDGPTLAANEMANTPQKIVADLKAVPTYATLFAKAFPGQSDPLTFDNVSYALASFERGLVAHDSPYDRFAKGDFSALSPSQRRGLALFRSGATGCYSCHAAPTFTKGEFAVTGVPDSDGKLTADLGRGAITGQSADAHAFAIPSLRNVALRAPYMHNGVFKSLDEVIAFYAKGGGKGLGLDVPNQSRFLHPVDLSDQERQDLINFLYALTDESAKPAIPDSVPSGLIVLTAQDSPARALVKAINTGGTAVTARPPTTLTVTPDQTIQSVADKALPGDTITIQYGTYHERVVIDMSNITIRGIPNASGSYPILDGQMQYSDGLAVSGNAFTVEKLSVMNYKDNGIVVDGALGVTVRDIQVANTSSYGIYPVHATNVLVERVKATGIRDAGIYAGQCRAVILRDNEAYGNVIGIEIENSVHSELYGNHVYDNSTGILVDLLPQLTSKVSQQTDVHDNLVEHNNGKNFARPGEIGALAPEGTGVLVLGGDDVQIHENTFTDQRTGAIGVFSTAQAFKPDELDIGPNPERVHVYSNIYKHNGYQPADQLTKLGISSGADIIWDASNWDVRFDDTASTFPPILPSSSWPDFARKGYWQIVHFLVTKLFA